MTDISPVTVRMLASLHTLRREHGLPTALDVEVPADGLSARTLAERLGLPSDAVEGAFHNHVLVTLDAVVRPGDRIAFLPYGTPATHPAFFGPPRSFSAGRHAD